MEVPLDEKAEFWQLVAKTEIAERRSACAAHSSALSVGEGL